MASRKATSEVSPFHPRVCFDRVLPRDQFQPQELAPTRRGGPRRAVLPRKTMWPNGTTLRVSFMEGTASQQAMVREFAQEWAQHANLKFDFGSDPNAEIRIAFQSTDGAWSYVGTDCRGIPLDQPTMNLGWQDRAVILHEFGHAIGLGHEHESPANGIQWNKPVVYRELGLPPNNWPKDVVDHNMFKKYDASQTNYTDVDKKSIMMYAFPARWTLNNFSTDETTELSAIDRSFIGSAKGYPKVGGGGDGGVPKLTVGAAATQASIGKAGEEDLFQFTADKQGRYVLETSGPTDVFMSLYGPGSRTALLAQDDDNGPGLNARIVRSLIPGTYFVQVRHYNRQNGSGKYGVKVARG